MSFQHLNKMKGVIERFGGSVEGIDTNGKALDALCGLQLNVNAFAQDLTLHVSKAERGHVYSGFWDLYIKNQEDNTDLYVLDLLEFSGRRQFDDTDNWKPIGFPFTFCGINCAFIINDFGNERNTGNLMLCKAVPNESDCVGFTADEIEVIKTTIGNEPIKIDFESKCRFYISGVTEE